MDLAGMGFSYAPSVTVAMVSYEVQAGCPQYLSATISAGQTWIRRL
jgi:hypothetical protein